MAWQTGAWAALAWASGAWTVPEPPVCVWEHGSWADGAWADGAWLCGDAPVVPPVVIPDEPATGGWAQAFATEQRRLKREDDERKRLEAEEKAALAREIAELETHLVDEGALEKVSRETDLLRLRDLAASFDALPNRAQRALDYAERAKTEAALILAQREMQRLAEEEEMAVVLMLAMMD